jgi:hypothetical protein
MSTTALATKTFTPLSELSVGPKPGQVQISKCTEVLPNRMQCWRAGDVLVTVVGELTTDKATGKPTQSVQSYQKCRRHALAEQEQYEKAQAAAQAAANDAKQAAAAVEMDKAKLAADQKKVSTTTDASTGSASTS